VVQNDAATVTSFTIRGYDKSHRLHRGKKAVFANSTDSDIVKKIADDDQLDFDVEATSAVHDHVFQDNQTDMEFVHDRAWRAGYLAYVENSKLFFRKASAQGSGEVLEWGNNLLDFQACFSSAEQVAKSEVRGWDVSQKKAITSEKNSPQTRLRWPA
jgi:phage protein D